MLTSERSGVLPEDMESIKMRGYEEIKAEINDLEGRISRPSTSDLDGILDARMWALKWVLREE